MATITLPATYPAKIKLTNKLTAAAPTEEVWNTGCSATGDPHVDEPAANTGVGTYKAPLQELPKIMYNSIPVLIWDNGGQSVILGPGESITVTAEDDRIAVYYLQQNSDALSAEVQGG